MQYLEAHPGLTSLDDEHRFVVNPVFLGNLPEMIIVSRRVLHVESSVHAFIPGQNLMDFLIP